MLARFLTITYFFSAHSLAAGPNQTEPRLRGDSYENDLEIKIWQAREEELPRLERQIVRLLQERPHSAFGHYLLAHLYLEKFNHSPGDLNLLKQASELAQQTAELKPTSDLGVVATCELLDVTGQSNKAAVLLMQAMGSGINVSWRSYFTLGKLKAGQESFENTLALFKQALSFRSSKPDIIIPHVIAGLRSQLSDDVDKLEEQLVSWNSMFPNILFLEALAGVMITKGNYRGAERIYDLVLKKDSTRIESKINYAILKLNFLGKTREGLRELRHVAKQGEKKLSGELLALVHSNMALAYLDLGMKKSAHDAFTRVHLFAGEEYTLSVAQSAYAKHNRHRDFINFLNYVVSEIGGSGLSFALLGETYSEQLQDSDAAIEAYQNAIVIDDKVSRYHNGLGLAYHQKKDFGNALRHFRDAIRVDPSDAVARYNVACMQARLGHVTDALASIQEAFALRPDLIQTAKSDPDLQNIRNLQAYRSILTEIDSIESNIQDILSH